MRALLKLINAVDYFYQTTNNSLVKVAQYTGEQSLAAAQLLKKELIDSAKELKDTKGGESEFADYLTMEFASQYSAAIARAAKGNTAKTVSSVIDNFVEKVKEYDTDNDFNSDEALHKVLTKIVSHLEGEAKRLNEFEIDSSVKEYKKLSSQTAVPTAAPSEKVKQVVDPNAPQIYKDIMEYLPQVQNSYVVRNLKLVTRLYLETIKLGSGFNTLAYAIQNIIGDIRNSKKFLTDKQDDDEEEDLSEEIAECDTIENSLLKLADDIYQRAPKNSAGKVLPDTDTSKEMIANITSQANRGDFDEDEEEGEEFDPSKKQEEEEKPEDEMEPNLDLEKEKDDTEEGEEGAEPTGEESDIPMGDQQIDLNVGNKEDKKAKTGLSFVDRSHSINWVDRYSLEKKEYERLLGASSANKAQQLNIMKVILIIDKLVDLLKTEGPVEAKKDARPGALTALESKFSQLKTQISQIKKVITQGGKKPNELKGDTGEKSLPQLTEKKKELGTKINIARAGKPVSDTDTPTPDEITYKALTKRIDQIKSKIFYRTLLNEKKVTAEKIKEVMDPNLDPSSPLKPTKEERAYYDLQKQIYKLKLDKTDAVDKIRIVLRTEENKRFDYEIEHAKTNVIRAVFETKKEINNWLNRKEKGRNKVVELLFKKLGILTGTKYVGGWWSTDKLDLSNQKELTENDKQMIAKIDEEIEHMTQNIKPIEQTRAEETEANRNLKKIVNRKSNVLELDLKGYEKSLRDSLAAERKDIKYEIFGQGTKIKGFFVSKEKEYLPYISKIADIESRNKPGLMAAIKEFRAKLKEDAVNHFIFKYFERSVLAASFFRRICKQLLTLANDGIESRVPLAGADKEAIDSILAKIKPLNAFYQKKIQDDRKIYKFSYPNYQVNVLTYLVPYLESLYDTPSEEGIEEAPDTLREPNE
jgi:hypothetical protein